MGSRRPGSEKRRRGSPRSGAPAPVRAATTPSGGTGVAPASKKPPSWPKRISATVLGAGALAGAISAVIGLWPAPDPVDKVTITSADLSWPEPLSGYGTATGGYGGTAAPVSPPPSPAPVPARYTTTSAPDISRATSTSTSTTEAPPSTTTSASTATGTTRATGTEPSPTGTTAEPTTEVTPQLPTPTIEPPDLFEVPRRVRDTFYEDVVSDPALGQYVLPTDPPEDVDLVALPVVFGGPVVDEDGRPVPPAEAAQRFAARLADVRTQPLDGRLDPLGVRVTVGMEIEGLRGRPLLLYWYMIPAGGPTPLGPEWGRPTAAYRVRAGTERDTAIVDVWIPLPEASGPYELELLVAAQSEGLPLESYRTASFG